MPLTIKGHVDANEKHDYDITSLLFHMNQLYSGADDGRIKVWNENLQKTMETQAHPCSIFSLAIASDVIYSCSNDGSVKEWHLQNLLPKSTVLQEPNEMWKLCFNSGKLYVGDDFGKVFILSNNKVVGILDVMHPISDLLAVNNILYTARDLYVIISEIHPETKTITTLQAPVGRAPICIVEDKLCFASRSGKDILIHDNSKNSDFQILGQMKDAHEMILNALLGVTVNGEKYLYSGGWDKMLKKWKIRDSGDLKMTDSCSVDFCITSIAAGPDNSVYVGGEDGQIVHVQ